MMKKNEIKDFIERQGIKNRIKGVYTHVLDGKDINFTLKTEGGSFTDGKNITVGVIKELANSEEELFCSLKFLTAHESEHIVSSNFTVLKEFLKTESKILKDEYNIPVQLGQKIGHHVINSVEDGRIEKRLGNRMKGLIKNIKFCNLKLWELGEIQNNQNELEDFLFCITSISKTGIKSKGFEDFYKGEGNKLINKIKPLILKGVSDKTAKDCADTCSLIMEQIKEYIVPLLNEKIKEAKLLQELLDKMKLNTDEDYNTSEEDISKSPQTSISVHFFNDEGDEEDENQEKEKGEGEEEGNSEGKEEGEEGEGSEGNSEDKEGEEGEGKGKGESSEDKEGEEDKEGSTGSEGSEDKEDKEGKEGKKENSEDKSGKEEDSKDKSDKSDKDNKDNKDNLKDLIESLKEKITEEVLQDSAKSIDSAKKQDAKDKKQEETVNKENSKYKINNREIDKVNENTLGNYQCDFVEDEDKVYETVIPNDVKLEAKKLRKIINEILDLKKSKEIRNKKRGKIDSSKLWKTSIYETDLFKKKNNSIERSYAFYVLVDRSGSMNETVGNNSKWQIAMRKSAVIEEALNDLIPFKVTSFCASYNSVLHYNIVDWKKISKRNYSLAKMKQFANGGNKDGYSIRVATKELLKREETNKVLIVISDGEPSAYETNSIAINDVKKAVAEARKDKINVFSIFIGNEYDRESTRNTFKKMYERNLISCNPNAISLELGKIIKKELIK